MLLTNAQVRALGLRAGPAEVTDLLTQRRYSIFWGGPPGSSHSDFSPLTPEDTEIMRQISGGWNWHPRPAVLHIRQPLSGCGDSNHNLAVGVHHFPHGSIIGGNPGLPNQRNTRPPGGWDIGGHMCMYFKDSTGGTRGMTEAALEAYAIMTERAAQTAFEAHLNAWLSDRADKLANLREFQEAVAMGITDGSRPRSFATRQEVAVMILRAIQMAG